MKFSKWTKENYEADAFCVAPKLLGQYLVHATDKAIYAARIVETEAYGGTYRRQADDGAHSFRGITKRTAPMFEAGGITYVYLIYGMYHCMNIVTAPQGNAQAVLIRAVEPVHGIAAMIENRNAQSAAVNLTNGPGKLCRAMDITLKQNRIDLCGNELFIAHPLVPDTFSVVCTERINIEYAGMGKHFPWRFYMKDNPYVSK